MQAAAAPVQKEQKIVENIIDDDVSSQRMQTAILNEGTARELTLTYAQENSEAYNAPVAVQVDCCAKCCNADRHENGPECHQPRVATLVDYDPCDERDHYHRDGVDCENHTCVARRYSFVVEQLRQEGCGQPINRI